MAVATGTIQIVSTSSTQSLIVKGATPPFSIGITDSWIKDRVDGREGKDIVVDYDAGPPVVVNSVKVG